MSAPSLIVGFTGRASALSDSQAARLRSVLERLPKTCVCLHNDGEGADQVFAAIAKELLLDVFETDVETPMKRNRTLVARCDHIIACPPTTTEIKGSGSWATIKYAKKANKGLTIILPE